MVVDGGSLTAKNGGMFYTTNTESTITLSDVDITYADDNDFYMTDGSTLTGAVTDDESNAGEGGDGYCNLYIGEDCTWTVTGDNDICIASRSGSGFCAGSDLFQDGIPTGGREYPETETLYHRREP